MKKKKIIKKLKLFIKDLNNEEGRLKNRVEYLQEELEKAKEENKKLIADKFAIGMAVNRLKNSWDEINKKR